jgi:hypothetical protein
MFLKQHLTSLFTVSALSVVAFGNALAQDQPSFRKLGEIKVNKPAFLNILNNASGSSLVISSFAPFASDTVSIVPNLKSALSQMDSIKPLPLTSQITWPNGTTYVSQDVFGNEGILVSGGFLVPGKGNGAVTFIPLGASTSSSNIHAITGSQGSWFYHKTSLVDMNGDGLVDVVTARANKPLFGAAKTELLWLENPGLPTALTTSWKEHIISKNADVHFELIGVVGSAIPAIVATEFFNKKLSITWQENGQFVNRVIDDKLGSAFDLQVVDVNFDGRRDLLVTNHESTASASGVFAYEIPEDLKKGSFIKHVLFSGIQTRQKGPNQASPGAPLAFYPAVNQTNSKPWILVSGDGSQRAHLLKPNSESVSDWSYSESTLTDEKCTVGSSAVGDVNGDGFAEVFVPAYDNNRISVFTFAPSPNDSIVVARIQ